MRDLGLAILRAALAELEPGRLVRAAAPPRADEVWAIGKAAHAMAGACPAASRLVVGAADAGHPVPDARSLAAGRALLERAAALPAGAEVVLAVSGGASALAVAPAWGLTLAEKAAATGAVSAAGAPIAELNCVRKHLSQLKGGRLAAATRAHVTLLVLSDVVGDDPSTIGSGPATADPTTFADALAIARRSGASGRALAALEAGARGELPETPKSLSNVSTTVLAGPASLGQVAARLATAEWGLAATLEPLVEGDVADLAARLARRALEQGPGRVSVFGGEPTIRLPPDPGRGGRAQHTALLVTQALAEQPPAGRAAAVLCAASDGRDGPTDAAGGVVDGAVVAHARAHRAALAEAVRRCDAGPFLEAAGGLVVTGPTGSNLADLYLVVT